MALELAKSVSCLQWFKKCLGTQLLDAMEDSGLDWDPLFLPSFPKIGCFVIHYLLLFIQFPVLFLVLMLPK